MTARFRLPDGLREQAAHSLTETLVATALAVTVLVPASASTVYLLTIHPNKPYLMALALGEQAMEEALQRRAYASLTIQKDGGRWTIERTVTRSGNRVTLRIRVFRRGRPEALVELMTVRLLT